MSEFLALGIDIGTSGVRVVATNAAHEAVAVSTIALPAPIRDENHITQ